MWKHLSEKTKSPLTLMLSCSPNSPEIKRLLAVEVAACNKDIIWLEADENYTRIYRPDTPTWLCAYTLKRFADGLPHFVRVRRDCLVNPAFVVRVERTATLDIRVWLTDGTVIAVARRRKDLVLKQIHQATASFD